MGRISNPTLPFDKQHPILMPAHSRFIELLIEHIRTKFFHANCEFAKAFIANHYWLGGGSNSVVKRILSGRVMCTQFQAHTATQIMGQLPLIRSTMSHPFSSVGVDHCDPFATKYTRHRSIIHFLSFLCEFVCMVTGAVHLELSSDLTADKFLDVFKRFISRHGTLNIVFQTMPKHL